MYKKTSPMELELNSPKTRQESERIEDNFFKPKNDLSTTDLKIKDKETIGSLFRDFAQITSAHGIGRIEAAVSLFRRLLWIAIVIGAIVALCYMCSSVIVQFLNKPVVTSVTMTFQKNLQFPSVTVCNMNMLRISPVEKLNEFKDLKKTLDKYDSAWPGYNETQVNNNETHPIGRKRRATDEDADEDEDEDIDEGTLKGWIEQAGGDENDLSDVEMNSDDMMKKSIEKAVTRIPKSKLEKVGHSFEDLIYKCSWLGFNCKKRDLKKYWNKFWNWKYGNCYVFNSGFDVNGTALPVFTVTNPGPDYGLSLDLFIDQDEYIGTMSPEAGVRIVLSEQGTMPFPYDQGFSVSPGTSSNIGIRKVLLGRADPFKSHMSYR